MEQAIDRCEWVYECALWTWILPLVFETNNNFTPFFSICRSKFGCVCDVYVAAIVYVSVYSWRLFIRNTFSVAQLYVNDSHSRLTHRQLNAINPWCLLLLLKLFRLFISVFGNVSLESHRNERSNKRNR